MSHTVRRPRWADDKVEEKRKRKARSEAEKCVVCGQGWQMHTLAQRRACRAQARKEQRRVLP